MPSQEKVLVNDFTPTWRKIDTRKVGIVLMYFFRYEQPKEEKVSKFHISSIQVSLVQINILPQKNKTNLLL